MTEIITLGLSVLAPGDALPFALLMRVVPLTAQCIDCFLSNSDLGGVFSGTHRTAALRALAGRVVSNDNMHVIGCIEDIVHATYRGEPGLVFKIRTVAQLPANLENEMCKLDAMLYWGVQMGQDGMPCAFTLDVHNAVTYESTAPFPLPLKIRGHPSLGRMAESVRANPAMYAHAPLFLVVEKGNSAYATGVTGSVNNLTVKCCTSSDACELEGEAHTWNSALLSVAIVLVVSGADVVPVFTAPDARYTEPPEWSMKLY